MALLKAGMKELWGLHALDEGFFSGVIRGEMESLLADPALEREFSTGEQLLAALGECDPAGRWTNERAWNWWNQHRGSVDAGAAVTDSGGLRSVMVDVEGRLRSFAETDE